MDKAWYVVWVSTGQEKVIFNALQTVPGIERTIFPVESIWERKAGEWAQREAIIFPGYLFIECRMTSSIYYTIKGMPYVLGWLGKDTMWPSTVRPEEMERLLLAVECVQAGTDPREWLQDVTISKRQRRGYGTLTIHGKAYKVPFNVYDGNQPPDDDVDETDKQPDEPQG